MSNAVYVFINLKMHIVSFSSMFSACMCLQLNLWLPCGFHEAFQVYALDDVNTMPVHQVQHLVSRKIKQGWMDHIPSSVLKYHNAILRIVPAR